MTYMMREIPIDKIQNKRKVKLDKELTKHIKKHGLLNPILVRRLRSKKFALVDGASRIASLKKLKQKTIFAIVKEL